jgi:hypothetical protein
LALFLVILTTSFIISNRFPCIFIKIFYVHDYYFKHCFKSFLTISMYNLFYCCAGWWYIVALVIILTVYQLYHTSIHPSTIGLYSPFPHSWNCFNRYHFSIYVHVCPVIALYSASHTLSQTLPSLTGTQSQAGSVSPSSSPIL